VFSRLGGRSSSPSSGAEAADGSHGPTEAFVPPGVSSSPSLVGSADAGAGLRVGSVILGEPGVIGGPSSLPLHVGGPGRSRVPRLPVARAAAASPARVVGAWLEDPSILERECMVPAPLFDPMTLEASLPRRPLGSHPRRRQPLNDAAASPVDDLPLSRDPASARGAGGDPMHWEGNLAAALDLCCSEDAGGLGHFVLDSADASLMGHSPVAAIPPSVPELAPPMPAPSHNTAVDRDVPPSSPGSIALETVRLSEEGLPALPSQDFSADRSNVSTVRGSLDTVPLHSLSDVGMSLRDLVADFASSVCSTPAQPPLLISSPPRRQSRHVLPELTFRCSERLAHKSKSRATKPVVLAQNVLMSGHHLRAACSGCFLLPTIYGYVLLQPF